MTRPRTLVISDLHIGEAAGRGVITRESILETLLSALRDFDRLVLLGDTLELAQGRPVRQVMAEAAPVLGAIGAAVDEVLLVVGNHDRLLIEPWITAVGSALGVEQSVPGTATPLLSALIAQLGTSVSVHYPGVWLSDRTWATHGHYLDALLWPQCAYGVRRAPARPTPAAYETTPRSVRRSGPRRAMNIAQRMLLHPRFAALNAQLLSGQVRRHSVPALEEVVAGFGVDADYVVFGHVHRLDPLGTRHAGHDYRFVNTGAWLDEPLLDGPKASSRPYWPGGAVVLEPDGIPRVWTELQDAVRDLVPISRRRRAGDVAG